MKKLISLLCTVAMLPPAISLSEAKAVSEAPVISEGTIPYVFCEPDMPDGRRKTTETPDLYALASSLGADTDYFNFPNYAPEKMNSETLLKFGSKINQIEATQNVFGQAVEAGSVGLCHGITLVQILTHNGVFLPSDIQEGAETLHDIQHNDDVQSVLCYYQMTQMFTIQQNAFNYYFCNSSKSKQCNDLIEYGEKAMEEGEYFYITLGMPVGTHAVTGIGAADGTWIYNEKSYDKCILTLDSNVVIPDTDEAAGFSEKACIYVNSETDEFYIPSYDCSDEDTHILTICDNEALLNYNGLINPIEDPQYDVSEMFSVEFDNFQKSSYEVTLYNENLSETYYGEPENELKEICENAFIYFNNCYRYFVDGDAVRIRITDIPEDKKNRSFHVHIYTDKNVERLYADGYFTAELSEHRISVENNNSEKSECQMQIMIQSGEYNSNPYCGYNFTGYYDGTFSMINRSDGILLAMDKGIEGKVTINGIKNDNGMLLYFGSGLSKSFNLTSVNNVLLKYDDANEDFKLYIDLNADDIYEYEVQKGDVNCDGAVTASDAANVLSAYTAAQIGEQHYMNEKLSDFNGDGSMTAVDAALILSAYAQSQVS